MANAAATRARWEAITGRLEDDFVVLDPLVARHQEAIVLGEEDGALDVVTGEAADRLLRIPEGKQEELCPVPGDATEGEHAPVAGRGPVPGEAGGVEVVEIGVGVGSPGGSGPGASDHVSSVVVAARCTSMCGVTGARCNRGLHLSRAGYWC